MSDQWTIKFSIESELSKQSLQDVGSQTDIARCCGMKLYMTNDAGQSLAFKWEPDTGEIAGRDAVAVESILSDYKSPVKLRGIAKPFEIVNPRHSRQAMAVLLSRSWTLPDDLACYLPVPDSVAEEILDTQEGRKIV